MPLPFSATGRVGFGDESSVTAAMDALERGLEQLRAKRITRDARRVEFTGGIFRAVRGDNLLVSVGSGRLSLSRSGDGFEVTYHLRFTQMLLFVTGVVLVVVGPAVMGASNLGAFQAGGVLVAIWLWLFGGNVALTLVRFPRWVERTVAAGHSK